MTNHIKRLYDALTEQANKQNEEEEEYFKQNPPIREFQIQREDDFEPTTYGVWKTDNEEVIAIRYKMPNGKYSKRNTMFYDLPTVKILAEVFGLRSDEDGELA